MVKQMLEIWGDKLVQGKLEHVTEDDNSATPEKLKGRIVLMVSSGFHTQIIFLDDWIIVIQVEYYPTDMLMTGTGEVDHELTSEDRKSVV